MTNGFALNHDKHLQIYFFCVKRQAKNDFLKDVESIVASFGQLSLIRDPHINFQNYQDGLDYHKGTENIIYTIVKTFYGGHMTLSPVVWVFQ